MLNQVLDTFSIVPALRHDICCPRGELANRNLQLRHSPDRAPAVRVREMNHPRPAIWTPLQRRQDRENLSCPRVAGAKGDDVVERGAVAGLGEERRGAADGHAAVAGRVVVALLGQYLHERGQTY